ncbi:MAG TPA: GntR family transcriptional regulator [Peptococcaceae bacterium]|nr:GntR family transcriptional regulator [Peptococcaceae bacterium]
MYDFDSNRPIYIQLMDHIKMQIVAGAFSAGSKLASVRDLASDFGVNPNTMQRALSELEREDLLFAQRTSGRFVTEDQQKIDGLRKQLATEYVQQLLETMKRMGYGKKDLLSLIQSIMEEM